MKINDLILPIGIIATGYFIYKNMNKSSSFSDNLNPMNTATENATIISERQDLFAKGKVNPIPKVIDGSSIVNASITPKVEHTSKAYQKALVDSGWTGVIPTRVTNTMPVTQSVANALKGTISPLTGKLRI